MLHMIDLNLSHKNRKNAKIFYTSIGGSHGANTGRGLSSKGNVKEAVNLCVNSYLKIQYYVHLFSNDVMLI